MTDLQLFARLKPKERDFLRAFVGGATDNTSLAADLSLSKNSIANYVSALLDVTGTHSRTELMLYVMNRPELVRLLRESAEPAETQP